MSIHVHRWFQKGKAWQTWVALTMLTLAAAALRIWRLGNMPLFGDEAFYLQWLEHPSLAYFDHPAGIAWLLKASTLIGGSSEWGVRWLSALLSAACVPLSYAIGRRCVCSGGQNAHRIDAQRTNTYCTGGWVAAAAVALGPVYIITGRIMYPDALQGFLLLLNLLVFEALLTSLPTSQGGQKPASLARRTKGRLALFGLTLFMLLNVKLTSVLYVLGLGIFLLVCRRDMLRNGPFLTAGVLGCLGILPILLWNIMHGGLGFRWTLFQGQGFGLPFTGLWSSLRHAINYLSPPQVLLACLALPSLFHLPGPPTPSRNRLRLLWIISACLLLPILLSAANSPRNLSLGLLAWWPLAGVLFSTAREVGDSSSRAGFYTCRAFGGYGKPPYCLSARIIQALVILSLLGTAVYGLGTATALMGMPVLPHTGAVSAIIDDVAGWPKFARRLNIPPGHALLAVDYSIAGQIEYYTGHPVFSSAGQYRIWGIPEIQDATVISRHFVLPERVTASLQSDFQHVQGPERWDHTCCGQTKTVYVWQAEGRRVSLQQMIDDLDYLSLLQIAAGREGGRSWHLLPLFTPGAADR